MVVNLTLNDSTQDKIIKQLDITSDLLSELSTILSKEKKKLKYLLCLI